jgi:transcriptional regulator with XRE-family HTH domain
MSHFKKITGLTQEEMALYLGVHRSQWSMYVSGKRALPPEATLKLSNLLEHLEKGKLKKQSSAMPDEEKKSMQTGLKKKLLEIEILLHQVNVKIDEFHQNREELFTKIDSLDFIKNEKDNNNAITTVLEKRVEKLKTIYSLKNLETLTIKKASLEFEINSIKKRLL